ncbi:methylthioribulose 1-phosphate dehydratase [Elongatibacter sediminis]|uniref:Methylthioribulose-1-phosphate dehydratase n=1 Tax=Elongatibacter sediminis TaxID=3119006 RepID=A0AAW9RAU9_9GAMM
MNHSDDFAQRSAELIGAGRYMHDRGWVPATSGNFSARLRSGEIAITVSGRHKGRLEPNDIMRVDLAGTSLDGSRPSAETLLHTSLYQRFGETGSVLHAHSPGSILASRVFPGGLELSDHELLKALPGITTHETRVRIPVFANDQDMNRLTARVSDYLDRQPDCPGYVIAGHGFYTWGATVDDALRHAEALEFLFDIEVRLHSRTQGDLQP